VVAIRLAPYVRCINMIIHHRCVLCVPADDVKTPGHVLDMVLSWIGTVQVFQKAGKAIAAQWSAASGAWVEIGEVG
jgi:hypothetical protein